MKIEIELMNKIDDVFECAAITQNIQPHVSVSLWEKLLNAEHSPIRACFIKIRITDIAYWVHVHLIRHKMGIEFFVKSQRPTMAKPWIIDRTQAKQDQLIDMILVTNPQALINIARKRLCNKTALETREVVQRIKTCLLQSPNEYLQAIARYMVPECEYRGACHELKPCLPNAVKHSFFPSTKFIAGEFVKVGLDETQNNTEKEKD